MIAAMAVAAGAAFAETAPITSANVVGYNTVEVGKDTFFLGGVQWAKAAGGDASIQDVIKANFSVQCYDKIDTEEADYKEYPEGEWKDWAPQIQVPAGGTYDDYYYCTYTWDNSLGDWIEDEQCYSGDWQLNPMWCNADGTTLTADSAVILKPGDGIWLKGPKYGDISSCTFTYSGAVPGDTTVELEGTSFNLSAVSSPVSIDLNSKDFTWNLTAVQCYDKIDEDEAELKTYIDAEGVECDFRGVAPQMQVPAGGTYDDYYYCTYTWDNSLGDWIEDEQCYSGDWQLNPMWCNADGTTLTADSTVILNPGEGLWFKVPNAGAEGYGFTLKDQTK